MPPFCLWCVALHCSNLCDALSPLTHPLQVVLPGAGNPFTEGQAAALADAISSIPAGARRELAFCWQWDSA